MGGSFKGEMNRNLIETREAKYVGSNIDSYNEFGGYSVMSRLRKIATIE